MDIRMKELGKWFSIDIDDHSLEAFLTVIQPPDDSVTSDLLSDYLKHHGIVYGIERTSLLFILNEPQKYIQKKTTVARGTPPVHGTDGFIRFLYQSDVNHLPDASNVEEKIDYRFVKELDNVLKGQKIAEKVPPNPC